ncbi:MAG: neutral/alkaline non-lysosomal ceramidase N-terminal domain-containing protein [Planctomycetaceae bacterium]
MIRSTVVWLCCLFVFESLQADADAGWRAGAASVVITPKSFMPMAGYASRGAKHAEGQLTDLFAKTLVLQADDDQRVVLVTLDLVGLERQLASEICQQLQQDHGLQRSSIVLSCSHTHSGPVVAKNLRPMHYLLLDDADRQLVDDYSEYLKSQVRAVVQQAIEGLAPAEVTRGQSEATFAVNRRNNREANVPLLREQGALKGPFDHSVPVLAVRRDGKLIATAFGYACHCTVLAGMEWSGDYAGFATADLEQQHPGCIALFWAGCGGDQNPVPRKEVELARKYGTELAAAVDSVLTADMTPVSAGLASSFDEIPLAFGELPSRMQLETDAQDSNRYVASRAKSLLAQLDAGQPLPTTYPYPVTRWQLGNDLQWYFLGGEVVVDYALRIKAELEGDGKPVWVAGYSQDVMAYIPSRRVLLEGGYEGGGAMIYYGRPTVWSEQAEEQILREVHRQSEVDTAK